MANYREILRLHSLGTSQRSIAQQVQSSRDTVADIIKSAKAAGISWPLGEDVTNEMIQELLYPGKYALACPYTQSTKSLQRKALRSRFCGKNTASRFAIRAESHICTRSSARSIAVGHALRKRPCASHISPATQFRWIGQETHSTSPIQLPERWNRLTYLSPCYRAAGIPTPRFAAT